ncbi:disks large-associated protein 5-like [Neodiprion pinetum]|uniref:disks large-associated protein 5-like n=1 Tax=Neodiprion pinetum TaxID=441929 RepID=UPI001EDF2D81|nr:uncharacterized protein LOC124213450 [Neodiprion pinetum]
MPPFLVISIDMSTNFVAMCALWTNCCCCKNPGGVRSEQKRQDMADLRTHYKKKAIGFGNLEESRIIRAVEKANTRKQRRSAVYAVNRKIIGSGSPATSSIGCIENVQDEANDQIIEEDRRMKLSRWRAERDLQKKIQKAMKPPVFRAGVCHHKLNSPVFLHQSLPTSKLVKSSIPPRITRATAKRLASKACMKAHTPDAGIVLRNKKPITKVFSQRNIHKDVKSVEKTIPIPDSSFAPDNYEFRPPTGLTSLPLFGQAALQGPKQNYDTTATPTFFSPYIVNAGMKDALRQKRLQQANTVANSVPMQLNSNELLTAAAFEKDQERTPTYFRKTTDGEVMRLKALCWDWMMIKSAPDTPEDAQLMINQAIGQTNLLIDKKVKQFRKLITECETGLGEKLVTCDDLQGFWDMMYMQVEDCDSRFGKLNQLKERNWQEDEQKKIKAKKIATKPSVAVTKKNVASKPSSIREMILAARKMKMESQANQNSPTVTISESSKPCVESLGLPTVKFDGGFFMVESPKKIVIPRSLQKSTPLPHPKFSEESKHRRSALRSIGVSQILKPLEIESEPLIPFSTFQQTPGKSILKQTESHKSASCTTRSKNKVNFAGNEEIFTKSNDPLCNESSITLHDSESINKKLEAELDVKKRLDFLSLDSSDSDSETQCTEKIHEQSGSELSCNDKANRRKNKNLRTLEDCNIVKIERNEFSDSIIVRDNSVGLARVTRTTRQSVLKQLTKEMKLDIPNIHSDIAETSYDRVSPMETSKLQKENKQPESPKSTKLRRSTRRSVKFTGEECTVCSSSEQVQPMTPHVKRRITKSSERRKSFKQ